MKYFAAAIIATTAFAQFDPTNCCNELPIDPRCIGCNGGPISMNHLDVTLLINGVLKGALEAEQIENLKTCKFNSHKIIDDINLAV